MSIELPEVSILADQMKTTILNKTIENVSLQNYERMQTIGFLNKNIKDFTNLEKKTIQSVQARGMCIKILGSRDQNLLLSPEYGGEIRYYQKIPQLFPKYHLKVEFTDKTIMTVLIKSMGLIYTVVTPNLTENYVYKRDFLTKLDPLESRFNETIFTEHCQGSKGGLKSLLVGKDAIIVGFGNSSFQDILFRAKLYPKVRMQDLNPTQIHDLYASITNLIQERIKLRGKAEFKDLFGNAGKYIPQMGPNWKGKKCQVCQTKIQELSFGGGKVFYCPYCQTNQVT